MTYAVNKLITVSSVESTASDIGPGTPSVGISPRELAVVGDVEPLGGGAGEPSLGMFPANAENERAMVRAIEITNRFIEVSPLVGDARVLTSDENRATSRSSCKLVERALICAA